MSLIFLLYGDTPLNAKHGLQALLISYQSQHFQSTLIQEWVLKRKDIPNWRHTLIEVLWTIKAKHVLRKLGLNLDDLHIRFLCSANAEVNLYIHPILKGLYCIVCEQLCSDEAKQLIDYVLRRHRIQVNFTDEKYLEVFLLHWLSELVIEAGEWSTKPSKRNVFCNVGVIFEFLNSNKPDLEEELRRIMIRFNYTSNNVTSIERKKNVTDDDGNEQPCAKSTKQNPILLKNNSQIGSDDKYDVNRSTAGFVLIINQIVFKRDLQRRVSVLH